MKNQRLTYQCLIIKTQKGDLMKKLLIILLFLTVNFNDREVNSDEHVEIVWETEKNFLNSLNL